MSRIDRAEILALRFAAGPLSAPVTPTVPGSAPTPGILLLLITGRKLPADTTRGPRLARRGAAVHGHAESSGPLMSMCWFAGAHPALERPLGVLRGVAALA